MSACGFNNFEVFRRRENNPHCFYRFVYFRNVYIMICTILAQACQSFSLRYRSHVLFSTMAKRVEMGLWPCHGYAIALPCCILCHRGNVPALRRGAPPLTGFPLRSWRPAWLSRRGGRLSGIELTSLPTCLVQLTALQRLDVSGNELTSLPERLGQVAALQTWDVSQRGCLVACVPSGLCRGACRSHGSVPPQQPAERLPESSDNSRPSGYRTSATIS